MSVSSEVKPADHPDVRRPRLPRLPGWASGTAAVQRVLAFGALIILFVVFSTLSEYFLNFDNVVDILLATAVNGVLALGATFVITTGGIDLSVGTVMTLSAVLTAQTIVTWDGPIALGIVVGIVTGATCGLANGLVIAKLKLPPFIATLGMFYAARGLALVISHSAPIYLTDKPAFLTLVMGKAVPGVPNVVLFFFLVAAIAAVVLGRTVLGRYTVALGSNEEATRLSGVPTDRWKIAVYTVGGTFTGLAGVFIAGRIGSAQPSLGGGHRRHLPVRRTGHDPRHRDRRLRHEHPHQRPASAVGPAGMADGHHRSDLGARSLPRRAAAPARHRRLREFHPFHPIDIPRTR